MNHDQIKTSVDEYQADRKEMVKRIRQYIFNAGILVLIVALSIAVSNWAVSLTVETLPWGKEVNERIVWWVANLITAAVFLVIITICVFVFDLMMPKWLSKQALRLEEVLDKLAGRDDDQKNKGIVPRMEAVNNNFENLIVPAFTANSSQLTNSEKGIIETLRGIIQKMGLLHDQVILYADVPGRTMANFIVHKEMIDADLRIVRLAGTMLGASGGETYSISEHIVNLTDKKLIKNKSDIFTECRVVLPGGKGIPNTIGEERYRLYPACGRFFALDTLIKIRKKYTHHGKALPSGGVSIKLRFKYSDIFPAWHIWGDERFLLLCSIGIDDKYRKNEKEKSIASALPIALGARKVFTRETDEGETNFQLSKTIKRLQNYFDNDLFGKDNTDQIETWELLPAGSSKIIKLRNLQESVWGNSTENKIKEKIPFWESICEESRKPEGKMLFENNDSDEVAALISIFREIGEIDNEETKDSN